MNMNYLLSVTDSIEDFFNENFDLSLKRNEVELHESFSNFEDGMFLNLKGNIVGTILLNYTQKFKNYVTDHLVSDLELGVVDTSLRYAALKEFLNQLAGHIVTRLEETGYDWDIDVPYFIENGTPKLDSMELETLVIPYFNEKIGDMKVKIALKEL